MRHVQPRHALYFWNTLRSTSVHLLFALHLIFPLKRSYRNSDDVQSTLLPSSFELALRYTSLLFILWLQNYLLPVLTIFSPVYFVSKFIQKIYGSLVRLVALFVVNISQTKITHFIFKKSIYIFKNIYRSRLLSCKLLFIKIYICLI